MWISLNEDYDSVRFEPEDTAYRFSFDNGTDLCIPDKTMVQMLEAVLQYDPQEGELNMRQWHKDRLRMTVKSIAKWAETQRNPEYFQQLCDETDENEAEPITPETQH